ncbi:hypothetical protein WJX73_007981 [Symbiochloris irregularis]|uniref:BZIP domain-containing protein n=1 Tax=Symbiochloris irregularis TaxID=706552 RepID=A0AAW1PYR0_9CHLO
MTDVDFDDIFGALMPEATTIQTLDPLAAQPLPLDDGAQGLHNPWDWNDQAQADPLARSSLSLNTRDQAGSFSAPLKHRRSSSATQFAASKSQARPIPAPKQQKRSPTSSQTSGDNGTAMEDSVGPGSQPGSQSANAFKEALRQRSCQAQRNFRKRQKEKIEDLQSQLKQLTGEREALASRNRMLESACDMREEVLRRHRERVAAGTEAEEDDLARSFAGSVTLTLRQDDEVTLSPEQIKKMTDRDLARYWAQYVKELAVLLVGLEGRAQPPTPIVERIRGLVLQELLFLYIRVALTNMTSVKRFVATAKIEEVRVSLGTEGIGRWRDVVDAMALTHAQRKSIVALWRSFHAQLPQLVSARRDIHSGFAATIPSGLEGRDLAVQYLKAGELMDQLKKNLRQEHVLIHEFLSTFYAQKLNPIQMARCVVTAFPYYPDIPAITLWVAADYGVQDAIQTLRKLVPKSDTATLALLTPQT